MTANRAISLYFPWLTGNWPAESAETRSLVTRSTTTSLSSEPTSTL